MIPVIIPLAARFVVTATSAIGASTVVGNVARATMPALATPAIKIGTAIGAAAIGSLVGAQVSDHVGEQFDTIFCKIEENLDSNPDSNN